jgi:hypothetical protein
MIQSEDGSANSSRRFKANRANSWRLHRFDTIRGKALHPTAFGSGGGAATSFIAITPLKFRQLTRASPQRDDVLRSAGPSWHRLYSDEVNAQMIVGYKVAGSDSK